VGDRPRPAGIPPTPPVPRQAATVTIQPVSVRTLVLAGLAILGVVLGILLVWHLLYQSLLVLTAIILAEGLRPGAALVRRWGLPFWTGIVAVYGLLVLAIVLLVVLLAGRVVTDLARLPVYTSEIVKTIDKSLGAFNVSGAQLAQLATTLVGAAGGVAGGLLGVGGGVVSVVGNVASIFLLSVTWMAASGDLRAFVVSLFPPGRRDLVQVLALETSRAFAGYVRGVAINMIAIGVLAGLACWVLRLPGPALLGVFAGLCELIPLLGPFLGAVPAVLLGFTVSPIYPLVVAVVFLGVQQVESNVLTPLVMRQQTGLRPFAILAALIAGAGLAGIWGALVAVPIGSALQIVVVRVVAPAVRRRYDTGPLPAEKSGEVAALT
jgi:predicted PurR-regulated permease PerM